MAVGRPVPFPDRRVRPTLALVLVVSVALAGCFGRGPGRGGDTGGGEVGPQDGGGIVRVGTWLRPEWDQPTLGGQAVRALVLPQLFVAGPDGTWKPSLVVPGSDALAEDAMSATFRLRTDAVWSNGSPITADDLRRRYDEGVVAGVEGPAPDGTITVRFRAPLPGWRRLWSFDQSVAAPAVGVWGGPWTVARMIPGLETVLRPNPRWWGRGPYLGELRLVVVPDVTTGVQLLERGELDVLMPLPFTGRTATLEAIEGVAVATARRSGWWFGLHLDPGALDLAARRALQSTVLRREFTTALLGDEALPLDGLAGPEDATWAGPDPTDAAAAGREAISVSTREEEPMAGLLHRSMAKRAAAAGWRTELRAADAVEVDRWFDERRYQGMLITVLDPPAVCWRCRWAWFDAGLATAADAGDGTATQALEQRLRDEAIALPIWRPLTVVAWRDEVTGVVANGYALTAAWNAEQWRRR